MRGVVMYGPGDVRVIDRDEPRIIDPTDAVIRLTATCICGSDLWPYRGAEPADELPMGHEYVGVVEEVGSAVETGKTVAVVGDGAVGLLGILAARELGAERIIAMSRHADRQALAREFGATHIVE